jgi:hypothetical protein
MNFSELVESKAEHQMKMLWQTSKIVNTEDGDFDYLSIKVLFRKEGEEEEIYELRYPCSNIDLIFNEDVKVEKL